MKRMIKKILDGMDITEGLYNKLRYYYAKSKLDVPDEEYAMNYYYRKYGKRLNLQIPVSFDEKVWWLKFHYHDELLTKCADKFAVREYVEKCGLSHILNELYGVFDNVDDIDFDKLPNRFYLKCNHVSGGNVACFDKAKFDVSKAKRKLKWYMGINQYCITREWQYKNIVPKIVAEKFLENRDNTPLIDYKFYCFHGKVKIFMICTGVAKNDGSHQDEKFSYENFYDMEHNPLHILDDSNILDESKVIFPQQYDKMVDYAEKLSAKFPFVRVDFYEINNEIVFGELTFTPAGGCHNYKPENFHNILGSYLDLSKVNIKDMNNV